MPTSSESAIIAEGLGKSYRIRHRRERQLRYALGEWVRHPLRSLFPNENETFWALRDASFQLAPGEALGIVGANGAGKSTLLKILSGITRPTAGSARLSGRVGSLLEVGTGFHPELTGRENIFLNGSILGMSRGEIKSKFDEIVAFAEVERFLDTPVKRYSSGMYVRLAFAVAAHLEPEILIIDEVLAVGDAAFQKKCLGKMNGIAKGGRTILFVSHNMAAVRSLCTRALLLREGRIAAQGNVEDVMAAYLHDAARTLPEHIDTSGWPRREEDHLRPGLRIQSVTLAGNQGRAVRHVGEAVELSIRFDVSQTLGETVFGFVLKGADGISLTECRNLAPDQRIASLSPGRYTITARIPKLPFAPGLYTFGIGARCEDGGLDHTPEALALLVEEAEAAESLWLQQQVGLFRMESQWSQPEPTP